ncbi:LysR family transcriptional regulator [Salinisphaera orenii]|uniref:LysR family transcriptional regulator n=1 Tax=Salinisphaera orenii TaxID=856731 RepID=UPI0013A665E5
MRNQTLDLAALQSLVTVVDCDSVTTAAARLNYSQSAVSMQLRRLETQLGTPLLTRTSRRIELTPAGVEAVGTAREMLRQNAELQAKLSARDVGGRVRLGIPADFTTYLPRPLARFAELYPRAQLEVRTELSAVLVERVRAGELDLAIVTRQTNSPGGSRLRREPLVWVGAPGGAAHQYETLPLAMYPKGYCEFRSAATARLDAAGRAWRAAYESQTFAALSSPVGVGLAITLAIPSMVDKHMAILDPAACNLPELPKVDIAVHRSPGRTSKAVACLDELITTEVAPGTT